MEKKQIDFTDQVLEIAKKYPCEDTFLPKVSHQNGSLNYKFHEHKEHSVRYLNASTDNISHVGLGLGNVAKIMAIELERKHHYLEKIRTQDLQIKELSEKVKALEQTISKRMKVLEDFFSAKMEFDQNIIDQQLQNIQK
jgi:hypothetical protein